MYLFICRINELTLVNNSKYITLRKKRRKIKLECTYHYSLILNILKLVQDILECHEIHFIILLTKKKKN